MMHDDAWWYMMMHDGDDQTSYSLQDTTQNTQNQTTVCPIWTWNGNIYTNIIHDDDDDDDDDDQDDTAPTSATYRQPS